MPIHEKMRTKDAPTTRNYLRVTMINIHDRINQAAMDTAAVIARAVGTAKNAVVTAVCAGSVRLMLTRKSASR